MGQGGSGGGVGRGREQCRGEGCHRGRGSSGQEAGHHWPVAAVLTTTTAEAAEATRKKHATTHKYTNITRDWVPAAWLSEHQGNAQSSRGGAGKALARLSPPLSLASTCPSERTGSEADYPGARRSPCPGATGENWERACACVRRDTFPCCPAERRETVSCRNWVGEMGA